MGEALEKYLLVNPKDVNGIRQSTKEKVKNLLIDPRQEQNQNLNELPYFYKLMLAYDKHIKEIEERVKNR